MVRHFLCLGLLTLTSSFAQANQNAHFPEHPQINEKVSQFTESLILAVAPEFEQGQFRYDLAKTDLTRGEIYGRFDGVTSRTEMDNFQIPLVVGTDIIFRITHENDKEYALNLDLIGQVGETQAVIGFLENALKPKCLENSAMAGERKADLEAMCSVFDSRFSNPDNTPVQNFALLIEEWKKQMLLLVDNKAHDLKGETPQILKSYINEQISVVPQGDKLFIEVNLAELGADLQDDNQELVEALKLNIIRINKLQALISNQVIEYDISLTKLHSKTTINKGMELGQGFQRTIEDQRAGTQIGHGLRDHIKGNDIGGMFNILMGANKLDAAGAMGRMASEKASGAFNGLLEAIGLGGSQNNEDSSNNPHSQDEADLGL